MKLKDGLLINKIENDYVLVDIGIVKPVFNGIMKLNSTSKEIVDLLKNEISEEEIVNKLEKIYDVSKEEIEKDVKSILNELKKNHIII